MLFVWVIQIFVNRCCYCGYLLLLQSHFHCGFWRCFRNFCCHFFAGHCYRWIDYYLSCHGFLPLRSPMNSGCCYAVAHYHCCDYYYFSALHFRCFGYYYFLCFAPYHFQSDYQMMTYLQTARYFWMWICFLRYSWSFRVIAQCLWNVEY